MIDNTATERRVALHWGKRQSPVAGGVSFRCNIQQGKGRLNDKGRLSDGNRLQSLHLMMFS